MENKKQVTIIGGGIVGLCSAFYLRKQGYTVRVIDKNSGSDGCSYGNAGFVAPSHFVPLAAPGMVALGLRWMLRPNSPFYIKPRLNVDLIKWGLEFMRHASSGHVERSKRLLLELCLLSYDLHKEMAESFDLNFNPAGLFMLCKTEKLLAHEEHLADMANDLGVEARSMNIDELRDLDQNIEINGLGGVYYPGDAFTEPGPFMKRLRQHLDQTGVEIIMDEEVLNIDIHQHCLGEIQTEKATYLSDEYVFAGGAGSPALMGLVGRNLLLEAGKGYSFDLENPVHSPSIAYILMEARLAVTPFSGRLRFAGTMEMVGNNLLVNHARANAIKRNIEKFFPQFVYERLQPLKVWSGLRPVSPDGLPYIGRVPGIGNLTLATGHAQLGFTLGPVSGLLVKELISGKPTSVNIEQLRVDRFN